MNGIAYLYTTNDRPHCIHYLEGAPRRDIRLRTPRRVELPGDLPDKEENHAESLTLFRPAVRRLAAMRFSSGAIVARCRQVPEGSVMVGRRKDRRLYADNHVWRVVLRKLSAYVLQPRQRMAAQARLRPSACRL